MGRQAIPPIGRRAADRRTAARPLLHVDRLLPARQPDLRHAAVPGPLSGRLPVYGSSVRGSAVRRRAGRAEDASRQQRQMTSRVAVLRVTPESIHQDIDRLVDLAGVSRALASGKTTILKDNISWHFPFPGANTTPWQLEGTIAALARRGFADQVCVQNKTVVTNAFKGEDLNHYVPIFKRYQTPVLYNFKDEDMKWIPYEPKARM